MKIRFGILGAGEVAQAFARRALSAGHEVILSNSRGPETLNSLTEDLGTGATAGTLHEAAAAPVVILAIPWVKVEEVLTSLPPWDNRIIVDATNHFLDSSLKLADLHGRASSELVQEWAPGARVVKALNTMLMRNFADGPQVGGGQRLAFVSGDDSDAKEQFSEILKQFGYATADLGSLKEGGLIQQVGGPLAGLDLVKLSASSL